MPPPFSVGRGAYSITTVRTYVQKNGFRSLSFEKISVLDSYSIHRYIFIKYRSGSVKGKNPPLIMGILALFQLHFLQNA